MPHRGSIHQPLAPNSGCALLPTFLAEHRVIGPCGTDDGEDRRLGLHIGGGGEVPGALVDAAELPAVHAHHRRTGPCPGCRDIGTTHR
ncbi:hypothetical protein A4E84_38910 [Streptomyces qaidamensis]|uniref:Uncharacterized protein n=1 Tax=Streptomyces qaidamensis TaxID=1783515 RepID=A0A143CBU6_9ACTN|nr:hypothetical protein A4E84_38910 [Streptomyces qaidamensis]